MKAVFFDMDGVLIDSETYSHEVIEEFLRLDHCPIPPERFYLLIGSHKSLNTWDQIVEGYDLKEPVEEFKKRMSAYTSPRRWHFDFASRIFPEVKDVVKTLKEKGVFLAVASSSNLEYVKNVLDSQDLAQYFDCIVTCDDFTHSKPDPEIYLYCLKQSGLSKEDCMIVEDSPLGIEAGKRAGIKVAARTEHHFGLDQSQADLHIDDLTALYQFLD